MSTVPDAVIEKFLDYYVDKDGTAYYQVKWKPTWERADSLAAFTDLINKFWDFVNSSHNANICQNNTTLPKATPVLPPTPSMLKTTMATTPKQTPKRRQSNPQTPRSHNKAPRTPTSSTKPVTTPRRLNQPQANINSPQFANNMSIGLGNVQRLPSTSQNVQQSAVVIDSDEDDDVIISSSNTPQENTPIKNINFQTKMMGNVMQYSENFPSNQNYSPQQTHNNVPNHSPSNQILPNGLNRFHPANRLVANRNNNMKGNGSIKAEPMNESLLSPNDIKQQTDLQYNIKNTQMFQQSPVIGRGSTPAKRSLELPTGAINLDNNNMGIKMETVDSMSCDNSNILPAGAKWQDYCETVESFINGNRTNVTYRCRVCSSTIAQKGNFSRHFNSHMPSKSEYECPICSKKFHRADAIENHVKQHGVTEPVKLKQMIKLAAEAIRKK